METIHILDHCHLKWIKTNQNAVTNISFIKRQYTVFAFSYGMTEVGPALMLEFPTDGGTQYVITPTIQKDERPSVRDGVFEIIENRINRSIDDFTEGCFRYLTIAENAELRTLWSPIHFNRPIYSAINS